MLDDLSLGAQVEAALVGDFPKATADAENGVVYVNIRGSLVDEKELTLKTKRIVEKVDGVKKVHVNIVAHAIED